MNPLKQSYFFSKFYCQNILEQSSFLNENFIPSPSFSLKPIKAKNKFFLKLNSTQPGDVLKKWNSVDGNFQATRQRELSRLETEKLIVLFQGIYDNHTPRHRRQSVSFQISKIKTRSKSWVVWKLKNWSFFFRGSTIITPQCTADIQYFLKYQKTRRKARAESFGNWKTDLFSEDLR